jgi:hypothetical protein|tara:strand:- start:1131 stop:2345 length:1215 start_codon:yes stop_codon:yes gene_type:complete
MKKEVKKEVENSVQYLELSLEEAMEKFESICEENEVEVNDPLAIGLWRNYVTQSRRANRSSNSGGSNSLVKKCFGFFVSLEQPRDMMSWNRNKAKEEYLRDADEAMEKGFVALAYKNGSKWKINRYYDGEFQERLVTKLPDGAEEMDDGSIVIPLDNTPAYMSGAKNKNYGKPLPKELMKRTGIFFGSVDGQENKKYMFSYKNQGGVEFTPNCYEWVHFAGIPSDDGNWIYGMTDVTKLSLVKNDDLNPDNSDYRDMSSFGFEDCLTDNFDSHLVPLVEIDRAHIQRQTLPASERFIITDGTVCNMNMNPTSNGNRIINITDLNAEFDYDNDSNMTTCWVPESFDIDFGIGSSIIIIGRTSQRTTDEGPEPVTINVSGIYATEKRGAPVESIQPLEEDFDWFDV